MPRYKVRVVRDTTDYADLCIEADSEEVAEEEAQIQALRDHGIDWERSTDAGAPYVADDETEELL